MKYPVECSNCHITRHYPVGVSKCPICGTKIEIRLVKKNKDG